MFIVLQLMFLRELTIFIHKLVEKSFPYMVAEKNFKISNPSPYFISDTVSFF